MPAQHGGSTGGPGSTGCEEEKQEMVAEPPRATPCCAPSLWQQGQAGCCHGMANPARQQWWASLAVSSPASPAQSRFTASRGFAVPLACGADSSSLSKVTAAEEQPSPASLSGEVWPSLALPFAPLKLSLRLFWWGTGKDLHGGSLENGSAVSGRAGIVPGGLCKQPSWDLGRPQRVPFILTAGCFINHCSGVRGAAELCLPAAGDKSSLRRSTARAENW